MRLVLLSFEMGEYSVNLSSALACSSDIEVRLISHDDTVSPHRELLDSGVDLVTIERPRMRQVWRNLEFLRRVHREIDEFGPDVVHIQHHQVWIYLFLLPLIRRRYPTVITVHDPVHHVGDRESHRTPQWIIHRGYRHAHEVIVHAEHSRRQMADELGFDPGVIHVIPHIAISNSNVTPPAVEEDGLLLLFFGRIWEYKGLEYLIEAEPMISERFPGIRIMIAGKGEDFERYRRMMKNHDRFIVHNEAVPWDVAAEYFARSCVVVLPYIDASSSGVIPVAYSFDTPVVATNVGGLPDMVEDGKTGFLVPPRDARAIADAVLKLLENPEMRREMGRNGKRKLDEECGPEIVARQTCEVYRKAAESCG